jgi:hypothetical protein
MITFFVKRPSSAISRVKIENKARFGLVIFTPIFFEQTFQETKDPLKKLLISPCIDPIDHRRI